MFIVVFDFLVLVPLLTIFLLVPVQLVSLLFVILGSWRWCRSRLPWTRCRSWNWFLGLNFLWSWCQRRSRCANRLIVLVLLLVILVMCVFILLVLRILLLVIILVLFGRLAILVFTATTIMIATFLHTDQSV